MQQAYYNYRKPTVVPPRPRAQLHPQALAQAEVAAEIQAHAEAQSRSEAIRTAHLGLKPSAYQTSYSQPKLGTFEQELLQLVSANQAQEFKLLPTQPKGSTSAYSQQLVNYPVQYAKSTVQASQLPEQYHIETSPPRYQQQQQQQPVYQSVEEPAQYQAIQSTKASQYDYAVDDDAYQKALEQAQAQAQAQAEAQALAFQKIAQAAYKKHHQDALAHMRITNEHYRQQSALEQIQQGSKVSDAGRAHLQEQLHPKGAEAAYKAKLKAQIAAEAAEARKLQQAQEFKAHADAIRKLEAQQQAHLKIQEEVHNYALNFEKNQARAQALAQAQAEALYKSQLQARNQAKNEILAISKGQVQAKKVDPDSSVYHYTLSTSTALPLLNNYFTNDQLQKHQASGSYVPRSVSKVDDTNPVVETVPRVQSVITQPRQTHKLKIPSSSQSVYVSESGLLKKSPIKSITIEEVTIEPDQIGNRPTPKGHILTEEDLSALINAGYTVTPIPQTDKSAQQIYATDNTSVGYYTKKQKAPLTRSEYVTYEEVIQRPRKLIRKNRPILKHSESEGSDASAKITYLVPLEPIFGTRQPLLKHEE